MADNASRAGERYMTPEIIEYVNTVHTPHDAGLARAFAVPEGVPSIQVGPSEGRMLNLLLRIANARKVVEVGTLFGQPPFASRSDLELIHKHLRDTPPEPALLWPEIPADLSSILVAMLAKAPADRPLLAEIVEVLERARRSLRPRPARRSWRSWLGVPRHDVLGRPALALPVASRRLVSATFAVVITLASLGAALL